MENIESKNWKKTLNYLLHDYNNCSITTMLKNPNSNLSKSLNNYQLIQNFLLFNSDTYDNKYTKEIIKNHLKNNLKNNKQIKYYNFILGGTINMCSNLLKNNIDINSKFYEIVKKNDLSKLYDTQKFEINIYKKKILYIFFYIIPKARKLIEILKKKEFTNNFGNLFIKGSLNHSYCMERFIKYNRLDQILNRIHKGSEYIKQSIKDAHLREIISSDDFYTELLFNKTPDAYVIENCLSKKKKSFSLDNLDYLQYKIFLDIEENFFINKELKDKYVILKRSSYMCIKYYTYEDKVKRFVYGVYNMKDKTHILHPNTEAYFSNFLIIIDNRKCIIEILSYCLDLLENSNERIKIYTDINDEDKIKKIIIIFYYLCIYLMCFLAGSASISEMSLFTLWNTYVNIDGTKPLIINPNTMLDVEVLSLTFTNFYHNCFNEEIITEESIKDEIKYTPYFL